MWTARRPSGPSPHLARPGAFVSSNRVRKSTGAEFGMVESTLRLFSATRDGGFRYVVLISGDTLPLYPAETIRTVLREAYDRGRQFISANPSITPEEADRIRRRRFCPDKSTFARRLLRIAMKCTMRADNPFFDRLPPLEKGSQWIAITDRMRDFIFDYLAAHPDFIPAFRYSHAADELFFHTLLGDSPFAGHNANYSLVHADWSHPGAHPKTLSTSDLSQLSVLKSRGGGKFPAFRPQVRRRAGHRPLPRNPVRAGN